MRSPSVLLCVSVSSMLLSLACVVVSVYYIMLPRFLHEEYDRERSGGATCRVIYMQASKPLPFLTAHPSSVTYPNRVTVDDELLCLEVVVKVDDDRGNLTIGYLKLGAEDYDGGQDYLVSTKCVCDTRQASRHHGSVDLSPGRSLSVGQTTPCTLLKSRDYHRVFSLDYIISLNAMLWPTLIFIVSFVGSVISAIYVCRDSSDHDLKTYRPISSISIVDI